MKRLVISILLAALMLTKAPAQDITHNANAETVLSGIFEYTQLFRVPTGYLLDRAFEVADIRSFTGDSLTTRNYGDIGVFRNSLLTINSSRVNSSGAFIDVNAIVSSMEDTTAIVLSAGLYKYNYVVENAISDQLITYQNGKVYDVFKNGVWQNPYGSAYLFVMCPSLPSHSGTSVRYKFSTSRLYGNCSVQGIQFDADNGDGYVSVNGTYDNTVTYTMPGTKELKMKVTLSNGITLYSHSTIMVEDPPIAPSSSSTSPDYRETFTLSSNSSVKAVVSIKYAPRNLGKLKTPFIYVEGFDDLLLGYLSVSSLEELHRKLTKKSFGVFDFNWLYDNSLSSDLRNEYDIVYVDWINPGADMRDNASLLSDIISSLNTQKHTNDSSHGNIIMGHSMGGLIARYALRTMELDERPHETSHYISFDSPHLGANVPLGLQYAFRDLSWLLYGFNGNDFVITLANLVFEYLRGVLESDSAKQMMYYYVAPNATVTTSYHDSWQATLDTIGFPEGDPGHPIENLSIVNGRNYSNLNSHFGHLRFSYAMDMGGLLTHLLAQLFNVRNITARFNIERNTGNGCVVSTSNATYTKKYLFKPNVIIPLFESQRDTIHYAPSGSIGYDMVMSSFLNTKVDKTFSVAGNNFVVYADSIMNFIPAASAIGVPNYTRDFYTNPPIPGIETPFDSYYIQNMAVSHEWIDYFYWTWLRNHIQMIISGGENFAKTGSIYHAYFPGFPSPISINASWTTSDPSVAVFHHDTLVVQHPGPVRLKMSYSEGSARYHKHLDVFAGFPELVLKKVYTGNNEYEIQASCADTTVQSAFQQYVNKGVFLFSWGLKVDDNDIIWSMPSSSASYQCQITNHQTITVYCRLKTASGQNGDWVSVLVQEGYHDYFCHDPQALYVNNLILWYDCSTISQIPEGNGNHPVMCLILWRNDLYPSNLVPTKVIIDDDEEVSLYTTYSYTLNGQAITLYRFNVFQSNTIQSTIHLIQTSSPPFLYAGAMHQIDVACGTEIVQSFILPVLRQSVL